MELTTEINGLEVTIKYTPYKAERMTRHYPDNPAQLDWGITHIAGMDIEKMAEVFGHNAMADLHDWIIDRPDFEKLAEQACWEDITDHAA